MPRTSTPAFHEVSQLSVGMTVLVPNQGPGEIVDVSAVQEVSGYKIKGIIIEYSSDPTKPLQMKPYFVAARNGQISADKFLLIDTTNEKQEWKNAFSVLQSGRLVKHLKNPRETSALYEEMLVSMDLAEVARIALTLKEGLLDRIPPPNGSWPYRDKAVRALRFMAERLRKATGRDEKLCRLHLLNVLAGDEEKPMAIFTKKFIPPERKVFVKEEKTEDSAPKKRMAHTSIAEELDLELPIAKIIHDTAFAFLGQERYEIYCRSLLARNYLDNAETDFAKPQTLADIKPVVSGALPLESGREAELYLALRKKISSRELARWRHKVDGDALIRATHVLIFEKKWAPSIPVLMKILPHLATKVQAAALPESRPVPAPG